MTETSPRPTTIPHLGPPSVVRRAPWQDSEEVRVSNWVTPWDGVETIDAGLVGLPYSGASITAGSAAGGPEAIRLAFRSNTTYSADFDVDVQRLRVRDLGDVGGHLTDVGVAHAKIEAAVAAITTREPHFVPIMLGGDHSVTAPAVRGFAAARAGRRIGLINIDAHHDVRNMEHGPHNGTPFRQLIEGGQVAGENLVELGIHGFVNSARYQRWLLDRGGTVISARTVQREGMEACVAEALRIAAEGADLVYVSVDIDCLAYPWAAGTSASTAEGLSAWQLLEAVWACGLHPKVAAFDLVEVDPSRDIQNLTARTACSTILTFLAGLATRTGVAVPA
ncbi:MAG: agmatinase family protein [Chloroflexia bacterium]|nr:agmatinase family protein [Chloroflexia bacterium]MDQ3512855.1 agmatinase family protein [Chloroflexota bacterium]